MFILKETLAPRFAWQYKKKLYIYFIKDSRMFYEFEDEETNRDEYLPRK